MIQEFTEHHSNLFKFFKKLKKINLKIKKIIFRLVNIKF